MFIDRGGQFFRRWRARHNLFVFEKFDLHYTIIIRWLKYRGGQNMSWRVPVTGVILLTVEYMSKVLVRMTVAKQLTKCFMQIKSEIHLIFSSFSHRLNVQIFKLCCNVDLFMGAAILIGRKHFFILPTTTYSLISTQHCIYWWRRM